jgi:hypothetical protein
MIRVPFRPENFSKEMKPKISGINLSMEYDNIASSLLKVGKKIPGIISGKLYDRLVDSFFKTPSELELTAIDYLQRAMLHFTIYEHKIFLVLNISNDGITTKKTAAETTAFKYQEDELVDNLLSTAWFWMDSLIQYLNEHIDDFPEWKESQEKKDYDALPITLDDFNKWVGVDLSGGEYFLMSVGWLIREVWLDCVCSRDKDPEKTDAIARAVCYEVIGRACQRLAYNCLPSPVRKDINNEMGKNHAAQADKDIRERVSVKFLSKAEVYWNVVDLEYKKKAIAEKKKTQQSQPIIGESHIREDDKFYFS